jgi:putative membrane protein
VRLLIKWVILAGAFALADWLLTDMRVSGGFGSLLVVAAIFGLVNAILGPILRLIALPLTILTLGLFALVVNAALLGIAASLTSRLSIHGFWTAVTAALIISVISTLANLLFGRLRDRSRRS